MDRRILLLFVLPLGVVAEANRCDGISWKYKVDFYLRPCWITAYFNGVPLNLAASEHFKCNLEQRWRIGSKFPIPDPDSKIRSEIRQKIRPGKALQTRRKSVETSRFLNRSRLRNPN
ncbi:hypothetical protein L596_012421 [Steinernema carpocapsae]|uniref:Uncharacterized protein n=1 Tax=Steinernema carpocapsae TaxID=34508 RepID=A0A4U5NXD8_STECR|nr:hypothetical protein L596_012421 [Steinernema carpocapsae]